jgi:hypothetical protein
MKTHIFTDIIAWIAAVTVAGFIQRIASDIPIQLGATLLACGIAGFFWVGLRALSCQRWSASGPRLLLALGAVIAAGMLALIVIVLFDIPAARGFVGTALLLAGIGRVLLSVFISDRRHVQIA